MKTISDRARNFINFMDAVDEMMTEAMASAPTVTICGAPLFCPGDAITITGSDNTPREFVVGRVKDNQIEIRSGWPLWLVRLRVRASRFAKSVLARLGLRPKEK